MDMRIKITSDGRVLEGTAKQIVEAMHYVAFGQEQRTLSEYIDWAVDQASRMNELDLKVDGETDEEKAASLVEAMLGAGLAEKV
jgi:ribose 5-phosphate isomerase